MAARLFLFLLAILSTELYAQGAPKLNLAEIEQLTGYKGSFYKKSGVVRITYPRDDLKVKDDGVKLTPAMGLNSWASFIESRYGTHVMGLLVLTENQVFPVMKEAIERGLKVTSLNSQLLGESPRIMYMHIEGLGQTYDLASAVGRIFKVMQETSSLKKEEPAPIIDPLQTKLDLPRIDSLLGYKGTFKDGVYKVIIGRTAEVNGQEMGFDMGVRSWVAFAGTDERAVAMGDLAMEEDEVQEVLKTLMKYDIQVVAINQHMLKERPRTIFVHFWAIGPVNVLAQGLQEALKEAKV